MKTIRKWALLLTLLAIALLLVFMAGCSTAPKQAPKPAIPMLLAPKVAPLPMVDTNILAQCLPDSGVESVTLSWCPPMVSTNTVIASYSVYYGTGQTTNWTPSVYDTNNPCSPPLTMGSNWCLCYTQIARVGNTNTVTITNLVPGLTYYFSCQDEDSCGDVSGLSNEIRYYAPYLPLTNFSARLTKVGNSVRVSAKVCPDSTLSVLVKKTLTDKWTAIATNLPTDVYGNFSYDYPMTKNYEFISLKIQ